MAADAVGEALGGRGKVHHVGAVGLEARAELVPVAERRQDLQARKARVPAQGAIGLAAQRMVQAGLGQRQQAHQRLVDMGGDRLPAHGPVTVADHQDHQRPEAQRETDQGRHIAQEPQGEGLALHGREYTPATNPADPVPLHSPIFEAMPLKLREKISPHPPNRYNDFPPISGALSLKPPEHDRFG